MMTDWYVDVDGVTIGETRRLSCEYFGPYDLKRDVVRLAISPTTPMSDVYSVLTCLYTNHVSNVVCLGNVGEVPLYVGDPGNFHPNYLRKRREYGVAFAAVGKSFVNLGWDIECDDRNLMPYLRKLMSQPARTDFVPATKKEKAKWFLLYYDKRKRYGELERFLIDAHKNGYSSLYVVWVDLNTEE